MGYSAWTGASGGGSAGVSGDWEAVVNGIRYPFTEESGNIGVGADPVSDKRVLVDGTLAVRSASVQPRLEIANKSATARDPVIQFQVGIYDVPKFTMGVDDSYYDAFKISRFNELGGNSGGDDILVITNADVGPRWADIHWYGNHFAVQTYDEGDEEHPSGFLEVGEIGDEVFGVELDGQTIRLQGDTLNINPSAGSGLNYCQVYLTGTLKLRNYTGGNGILYLQSENGIYERYVGFKAADMGDVENLIFTLPAADADAARPLMSDGAAQLYWGYAITISDSGPSGGQDGDIWLEY